MERQVETATETTAHVCSASAPRNSHILMITTTMQAGSPDGPEKRSLELLAGVSMTSNKLASRDQPPKLNANLRLRLDFEECKEK